MTAYMFRAPAGVAGDVTRPDDSEIEPIFLSATNTPQEFGIPVCIDGGKAQTVGDRYGGLVYGVLTRAVPCIGGDLNQAFGAGKPNPQSAQGVLVDGYVLVNCASGTPQRGMPAYIRGGKFVADNTGPDDIETAAVWASEGKDDNGLAELRFAVKQA